MNLGSPPPNRRAGPAVYATAKGSPWSRASIRHRVPSGSMSPPTSVGCTGVGRGKFSNTGRKSGNRPGTRGRGGVAGAKTASSRWVYYARDNAPAPVGLASGYHFDRAAEDLMLRVVSALL